MKRCFRDKLDYRVKKILGLHTTNTHHAKKSLIGYASPFTVQARSNSVLPINGTEEAAGGVRSARRSKSRKNATKIFMPEKNA